MFSCGAFLPSRIHRKVFLPVGPQINSKIVARIKDMLTFFRPCARAKPVEPMRDKQLIIDTIVIGALNARLAGTNDEDLHRILKPKASGVKRS